VSELRRRLRDVTHQDGTAGGERVPTWRDGVQLSRQEVALLTAEQLQQYLDDSVIRDLAEIEQMPEPMRSWAQRVVERARARVLARVAEQERRSAS
jgi:hypothetical protein